MLEIAIVEAKYDESRARALIERPNLFPELVSKANGEFIQEFFDKGVRLRFREKIFGSGQKMSRPYYENEVAQKLVDMRIAQTLTCAKEFLPKLVDLQGETENVVFDTRFFGKLSTINNYHFEIIKRGSVGDIYYAVCT